MQATAASDLADSLVAMLLSQPTEAFPQVYPVHSGLGRPPALEPQAAAARDSAWSEYVSLIGPPAVVLGLAAPLSSNAHESLPLDDASSPVIESAPTVTVSTEEPEGDFAADEDQDSEPAPPSPQPSPQPSPSPQSSPQPQAQLPQQSAAARSWASVASKVGKADDQTPVAAPSRVASPPASHTPVAPEAPQTTAAPTVPPPAAAPAPVAAPAAASSKQPPQVVTPQAAPVTRESVNPRDFDWEGAAKKARHFVIKSYTEDDVRQSLRFNVWASTDSGNRRLDGAYREHHALGPVFLYFSVNGSGHFCGMAQMTSPLDFSKKVDVWASDKWNGCFTIRWIFVKNIPNSACRHIRLENNEGKPVTNSRDTQEVLQAPGRELLRIVATYAARSSLLDGEAPAPPAAAAAAPPTTGKAARR